RIKVAPSTGGAARDVTPEPGHYLEPTFSPDGSLIAYRKSSDGYLTTALWGREPGIYVVSAKGGKPTRVTENGYQPEFGATNDRIFFPAPAAEGKRELHSVNLTGGDEVTHVVSQNAGEFALSPDEQYLGWGERYQPYVMPFVRSGRSIEISPDTKALPVSRISADAGD